MGEGGRGAGPPKEPTSYRLNSAHWTYPTFSDINGSLLHHIRSVPLLPINDYHLDLHYWLESDAGCTVQARCAIGCTRKPNVSAPMMELTLLFGNSLCDILEP